MVKSSAMESMYNFKSYMPLFANWPALLPESLALGSSNSEGEHRIWKWCQWYYFHHHFCVKNANQETWDFTLLHNFINISGVALLLLCHALMTQKRFVEYTQWATARLQLLLILRPFWGYFYIHIHEYIRYVCFFLD